MAMVLNLSVERDESPIMVGGVIGFLCVFLDHDPFCISRTATRFWIYVILSIAPSWQAPLPVSKFPTTDISGQWRTLPLLHRLEHITSLLRSVVLDSRTRSRERRIGRNA